MKKIKIVADTNVLISAFGWKGNEYNLIEKCLVEEITLILSVDILSDVN